MEIKTQITKINVSPEDGTITLGLEVVLPKALLEQAGTELRIAIEAQPKKAKELYREVHNLVTAFGMPRHLNGFDALVEVMQALYNDRTLMKNVTTKLYPLVAEKMDKTPSLIERNIRHGIQAAWDRKQQFIMDRQPTNTALFALLLDQLVEVMEPAA